VNFVSVVVGKLVVDLLFALQSTNFQTIQIYFAQKSQHRKDILYDKCLLSTMGVSKNRSANF